MIDLTAPIIPYRGVGFFNLRDGYQKVKAELKAQNIRHNDQLQKFGETYWRIINIFKTPVSEYEAMTLFFAKDQLFKICLCEDFAGTLPNGIHTGMNILEAKKIDPQLQRDEDWDEVFESPAGYLLEYSNGTLKIIFISIFIQEFVTDDFERYEW